MTALEIPTLVLNRSWMPIHTLPAKFAIGMVARDAARIIDPETYEIHDLQSWHDVSQAREFVDGLSIKSESLSLAPLEVIVLTSYSGVGDRTVTFSRLNLYRRDRNTCQYCGKRPGTRELTIDHILPRSRGGQVELGKLRTRLHQLQQTQGQQNARRSSDETSHRTDSA